jgi:choline dehydrogenase
VVTDALVHRVLIDGDRCTGVEYHAGTQTVVAECSGEVVLAAGAIGTPQVMLLSGIGPADHLRDQGVEVVGDLPGVGANLLDHPVCGVVYQSAQPVPVGTNNHGEVQGILSSGVSGQGPDVQIQFVDIPLHADSMRGPGMGDGYTLMVSLMMPFSRGSIRLASKTAGAHPVIDPRYYTDPRDVDIVVAGLRIARQIGAAPALAPWRNAEVLPGPDVQDPEDLGNFVRTNVRSYSHYAGTCAIGTDEWSVVDADLRVRGIRNLRVADASVMPSPVSANTNATVYAIAERAAELIQS